MNELLPNKPEEIVISKKIWDRVQARKKMKDKGNHYLLQVFNWWTDKPQTLWRACIVK